MELITILITGILSIILLAFIIKFNMKNIKKIKQTGENQSLKEITNLLPENEIICKNILKMLKNENVKIKHADENSKTSFYIIALNTIIIANVKDTFMRVQTIAHECIHSIQDKRLLWFNYIFSNVYLLYFIITTILAVINKLPVPSVFAIILIMMSITLYFVRSYIETDAMIKARYVAKEYMENNEDLINKENIDLIIGKYDELNDIGVKFYNFKLLFDYMIKIVVFCVAGII